MPQASQSAGARRGPRRWRGAILFLVVAALAVSAFVLIVGHPRNWTRQGIELTDLESGGVIKTSSGSAGPIAVELLPALADEGLEIGYLQQRARVESGLFWKKDQRAVLLEVKAGRKRIGSSELGYVAEDADGRTIASGKLPLPQPLEPGETCQVEIELVLRGDSNPPARIRIGK